LRNFTDGEEMVEIFSAKPPRTLKSKVEAGSKAVSGKRF